MFKLVTLTLFFAGLLFIGYSIGANAFQYTLIIFLWLVALFIMFCEDEGRVYTFNVSKSSDKKATIDTLNKLNKRRKHSR